MKCTMCNCELSEDVNSLRYNCGGDCCVCMADSGDPDCIKSVLDIKSIDYSKCEDANEIELLYNRLPK